MEEETTLVARTAFQRLMMEQALAMAKELEQAGDAAPDGQVLDQLETLAVARGRDFTRGALEGALQRQVDDLDASGTPYSHVAERMPGGPIAKTRASGILENAAFTLRTMPTELRLGSLRSSQCANCTKPVPT